MAPDNPPRSGRLDALLCEKTCDGMSGRVRECTPRSWSHSRVAPERSAPASAAMRRRLRKRRSYSDHAGATIGAIVVQVVGC